MPTKAMFDNNFLDAFEKAPPAKREAILRCVEAGQLEIYVSHEVLRELMGLAHTKARDKLIGLAGHVLATDEGQVLEHASASA
jgi:predicted nucleic acid-binding protein